MSSVTPTEPYNGAYVKKLSDLEEELRQDYKRLRKNELQNADELNERYRDGLRQNSEKSSEAVEKIQKDMEDRYERSRDSDREQALNERAKYYDRLGRDRTADTASLRHRQEAFEKEVEAERANRERSMVDLQEASEKKSGDITKIYENRMAKAVENERDSSLKLYDTLARNSQSANEADKQKLQNQFNTLNRARMEEQQESRRRTETLITDAKRDMENLRDHSEHAADQRIAKSYASLEKEMDDRDRMLHDHYRNEGRELREQMRDLTVVQERANKQASEARAQSIRENEDDFRRRNRMADDAAQAQLDHMKHVQGEAVDEALHKGSSNLRAKDAYYSDLMAEQRKDNNEQHKATVAAYETSLRDTRNRASKEENMADERVAKVMHQNAEETTKALNAQATSFSQSATNQHKADLDNIRQLQKELHNQTSPEEASRITPAMESTVRRSVVKEYEKNFSAETERNKRQTEAMRNSYSDKMHSALDEKSAEITTREREHNSAEHQAETQFNDHVQDMETAKNQAIESNDRAHDHEIDMVSRNYSKAAMRQKGNYDTLIDSIREDASTRLREAHHEAEHDLKTQRRAFSVRESELVREYDKKLAEQKDHYDGMIDDLKAQNAKDVHDIERRDKASYDELSRGNDQRLAMVEEQHKERERSITQNFQDELEKVRRANAIQQSKKG